MLIFFPPSLNSRMLPIRPASQAATLSRATPPAPPTAMKSGMKWARAQVCGMISSSPATCKAPPLTAASMPPPSLPHKAAQLPPLVPSGPKTKSHGRTIQQEARGPQTLHPHRHPTLLTWLEAVRSQPRVHQPFHQFLIVAPTASVMPPPIPGAQMFCYSQLLAAEEFVPLHQCFMKQTVIHCSPDISCTIPDGKVQSSAIWQ